MTFRHNFAYMVNSYVVLLDYYFNRNWLNFARENVKSNIPFFYKQRFFSTQPHFCSGFSWIELQMLLRCWLIHTSIIILGDFLYLLCPCLDLQSVSQYFETFRYFTKFSFHHRWNDGRLLLINMVFTSCLASCRTT